MERYATASSQRAAEVAPEMQRTILIADDHGLYRRGMRQIIESSIPDVGVLEASCFDEVLSLLETMSGTGTALIDRKIAGIASLADLGRVKETCPSIRFVVISFCDSPSEILEVLAAGLHGFISKRQSDSEIINGINDVLSGRIYVPPYLAGWSLEHGTPSPATRTPGLKRRGDPSMPRLTKRQLEVLQLIVRGLSNKEIARRLDIAEPTAKIHMAAITRILDVRNRTEAALVANAFLDRQDIVLDAKA